MITGEGEDYYDAVFTAIKHLSGLLGNGIHLQLGQKVTFIRFDSSLEDFDPFCLFQFFKVC